MHVSDRYVPPSSWFVFPPWRDFRKRWFNFTQSYMWTNRIALTLADQARLAAGRAPKRITDTKRQIAMSIQLMVPRALPFISLFTRRSFARNEASDLYRRLNAAYATADTAAIKSLAADNYARTLISQVKHRQVPPGLALAFDAKIHSAQVVNVRCAIVPQPPLEFGQVLVRIRSTQSLSVIRPPPPNAPAGTEPQLISKQTRKLVEVIAFERNLLDKAGGWLVLDRISTEVLHDSSTAPPTTQ